MNSIKYLFIASSVLLILSGCIATKRGMFSDNVYFSEKYPDIKIDVDPDFKYIKGEAGVYDHFFQGPYGKRALIIDYEKIFTLQNKLDYYNHPQHWIYYGIPDSTIIIKGETELLGETWYYANTFQREETYCYLGKHLRRFTYDQNIFALFYIMKSTGSECSKWENSLKNQDDRDLVLREMEKSFQKAVIITRNSEDI